VANKTRHTGARELFWQHVLPATTMTRDQWELNPGLLGASHHPLPRLIPFETIIVIRLTQSVIVLGQIMYSLNGAVTLMAEWLIPHP